MLSLKEIQNLEFFNKEKLLSIDLLKNQGSSNTNYLLCSKTNTYVLRELNASIELDREKEILHQNLAFNNKLAAKAHFLSAKKDLMLCDYLKGKHKNILQEEDITALVSCLDSLHKIKISTAAVDLTSEYKSYNKECLHENLLKEINLHFSLIKTFETDFVFCHNDLNQGNILFDKRVQLIDWEYSSLNDRYFDLANIIIEFNFNKDEERIFLTKYFKEFKNVNKHKLYVFKVIYLALCLLWFDAYNEKNKRDLFIEKILTLLKNKIF